MRQLPILIACATILIISGCKVHQNENNSVVSTSKDSLRLSLTTYLHTVPATVGIAVISLEDRDTLVIHNDHHYPMQSVYKFPLALAILSRVDHQLLQLNDTIVISKEYLRPNTWSPLRDKFPEGTTITVAELLDYSASQSDNNACDILFDMMGGPTQLNDYIHQAGIADINIIANEHAMHSDRSLQYQNWATPLALATLLDRFYFNKIVSGNSTDFLMQLMIQSPTGQNRLRGGLPENTIVAHKTGTSDTNEDGITAATNDIGIISLPNGKHFAIAVLVSDSLLGPKGNEGVIATVAKMVYDAFIEFK